MGRRSIAVLALAAVALAGCGAVSTTGAVRSRPITAVEQLSFTYAPLPPLRVSVMSLTGRVLQVAAPAERLVSVNRALLGVFRSDEDQTRSTIRQWLADPGEERWPTGFVGSYTFSPTPRLALANRSVVSLLVPVGYLIPDGNGDTYWISGTYLVPSGRPVDLLTAIFTDPTRADRALRSDVVAELLHSSQASCLTQTNGGTSNLATNVRSGIVAGPTASARLALVRSGMAVAFPDNEIAAPACGLPRTVIPYASLWRYLNAFGRHLVQGRPTLG